jgi:hypothetical protein
MSGNLFVTDWDALDEPPFCGMPVVVGRRAMSLCTLNRRKRDVDRLKGWEVTDKKLFD